MGTDLIKLLGSVFCGCKGTQVLRNGGFEEAQILPYYVNFQPPVSPDRCYQALVPQAAPGWSVVTTSPAGPQAVLIQNFGQLQYQNSNLELPNVYNSPEGNQFVRLDQTTTLSQTVPLIAGKTYLFSFLQSGYFNYPGQHDILGHIPADVRVSLSGPPGYAAPPSLSNPYTIESELPAGTPPVWRRTRIEKIHIDKSGDYTFSFKCGPNRYDETGTITAGGQFIPAAHIDAVCLIEQ